MILIRGKSVCEGVAIGRIHYFAERSRTIEQRTVSDAGRELERFETARAQALKELKELFTKAVQDVGEEGAAVFDIHQMMLADEDYLDSVREGISGQSHSAEYAVSLTREEFAAMLAEMDDPYMQARAADVRDISDRLLDCLCGKNDAALPDDGPVILAARDLTPSQTVQLDRTRILALVTAEGTGNSHTAILARTMGIPALIQAGDALTSDLDGKQAVVDGTAGILYVEPDARTLETMEARQKEEAKRTAELEQFRGKPNITQDGREIMVYANIGSVSEIDAVLKNDAGGIGLFRSEFLYLEGDRLPDEEKQLSAYRAVAKAMGDKRAIIRTLDIGADKRIGYMNLPQEENPALGLRGVRLCLERQDVFTTQLRALYRASAYGRLALMFPMIASVWEIREIKARIAEIKDALRQEGVMFNDSMELGVMIETPAAALVSDQLAAEVDFFSIGTNDLTQYTLAVDRQNNGVDRYCDPHHDAVFRLIDMVVKNAHARDIWVGVCGELAADESATEKLLRLGVDELSVSPPKILPLRQKIGGICL